MLEISITGMAQYCNNHGMFLHGVFNMYSASGKRKANSVSFTKLFVVNRWVYSLRLRMSLTFTYNYRLEINSNPKVTEIKKMFTSYQRKLRSWPRQVAMPNKLK